MPDLKTKFMNLVKYVSGSNWAKVAQDQNDNLEKIAGHRHIFGEGTAVPTDGLDIDKDLPFNNNGITKCKDIGLIDVGSHEKANRDSFYRLGNNFYFKDSNGDTYNILFLEEPSTISSVLILRLANGKFKFRFTLSDGNQSESDEFDLFNFDHVYYGVSHVQNIASANADTAKIAGDRGFIDNKILKNQVNFDTGSLIKFPAQQVAGFYYYFIAVENDNVANLRFIDANNLTDNYWIRGDDKRIDNKVYQFWVRRLPVKEGVPNEIVIKNYS